MNKIAPNSVFSLEEATQLLDKYIAGAHLDADHLSPFDVGSVAGLLALDEEVEVVIKFLGRFARCNKAEFVEKYQVIDV